MNANTSLLVLDVAAACKLCEEAVKRLEPLCRSHIEDIIKNNLHSTMVLKALSITIVSTDPSEINVQVQFEHLTLNEMKFVRRHIGDGLENRLGMKFLWQRSTGSWIDYMFDLRFRVELQDED